jgi:hypothetical protein
MSATYPHPPPHPYPISQSILYPAQLGLTSSQAYISWHKSNLESLVAHTQVRLLELKTTLADPSVTGKERKCLRARRNRALKSLKDLNEQIQTLQHSLSQMPVDWYQSEMALANAAAVGGYYAPGMMQPRWDAYDTYGAMTSYAGSFDGFGSSGYGTSGWETPTEFLQAGTYSNWSTVDPTEEFAKCACFRLLEPISIPEATGE